MTPIILSGGSGTRLWPLSRSLHPKQYLPIGGEQTLLQQAALRLASLASRPDASRPPIVVANEEHRFTVVDQLQAIGQAPSRLLLEPVGRNTAPALTLAALAATADRPVADDDDADPVLVVAPADHAVIDTRAFRDSLQRALRAAGDGAIVVLGVRADRPETGFGYIRAAVNAGGDASPVDAFVEKPDADTAARYVAEGGYLWNSGMFVLRASVWLNALAQFRPDIRTACDVTWQSASDDGAFLRFDPKGFARIPSESIDYAVMEPACRPGSPFRVVVVPLDCGWSDLGAWDAVWQIGEHDAAGNVTRGDVHLRDSRNTLVHASSRMVGAIGLDDLTVVETADAVLVAHRSRSPEVKALVADLAARQREEATTHLRVHRPWGWYERIDSGPRFQVKRIMVKPGGRLSLQMHHHRAEHWIVVTGTAEVTNGDTVTVISENQSTYIPLGQKHRLANPGRVALELIEVQSGAYLGEDDIVRFDDRYGRT